eukprot:gene15777-11297_t
MAILSARQAPVSVLSVDDRNEPTTTATVTVTDGTAGGSGSETADGPVTAQQRRRQQRQQRRRRQRLALLKEETAIRTYAPDAVMRCRQQLRNAFSRSTTSNDIGGGRSRPQHRRRNAVRAAEETPTRRGTARRSSTEPKASAPDTLTIVIDETAAMDHGPSTMTAAKDTTAAAVVSRPVEEIAVQHLLPTAATAAKVAWLSSAWWKTWLARGSFEVWEATVAFGAPLVFAWVLYVYYTYIAGGLGALSPSERSVVIAVVVVVVVVVAVAWWMWRHRRRTVHVAMNTLPMVVATVDTANAPAISHRMAPWPSVEGDDDASLQWSMSSSMDDDDGDDGGSSWDGSWRDAHSDSQHSIP